MTQNEIARRLQRILDEYTTASLNGESSDVRRSSLAGHSMAVSIGYLITDIDAEVESARYTAEAGRNALDRARASVTMHDWSPVAPSPHNSLDGE